MTAPATGDHPTGDSAAGTHHGAISTPPASRRIPRTLVMTGHFPPRAGGVATFTVELLQRLPAGRLVVVAPAFPGAAEADALLPYPVVRRHGYLLFRGLRHLVQTHHIEAAWITGMAPFGLYAPLVRAAGVPHVVASTHGQEIGWVRALPTRWALAAAARSIDVLTYLSPSTLPELEPVVGSSRLVQLAGGVQVGRFSPQVDGAGVRHRYGLGDGPVVISVGRLVRRKGHDVLLRAWPRVLHSHPDARLLVVGDGPLRGELAEHAARRLAGSVVVTGPVPDNELPAHYAAADAFVLPCRDARRGLQTEGLGLTTLEASASGLPVVVGVSGGSPASVQPGTTGLLVDARHPGALADAVLALLDDPTAAQQMGAAGRQWALRRWTWGRSADRLAAVLRDDLDDLDAPDLADDSDPVRCGAERAAQGRAEQ